LRVKGVPPIPNLTPTVGCGTHADPDASPILRAEKPLPLGEQSSEEDTLLVAGFGVPLPRKNAAGALYKAIQQWKKAPPTILTAFVGKDLLKANPKQCIPIRGEVLDTGLGFGYRTEGFTVDPIWLLVYWMELDSLSGASPDQAGQMVSSVTASLDWLWPEFRAAARGDMADFHGLLGCYNVHRSEGWPDHPYLFWSNGWGAPHKVHLYMCQLALTYGYFAKLTKKDINKTCNNVECTDCSCCFRKEVDCEGELWDAWEPIWLTPQNVWGNNRTGAAPIDTCFATAQYGGFVISFMPAYLAFHGFVCDQILFLARMCLDYGYYLVKGGDIPGAQPYFLTATHIGRYALRIITEQASVFIHEMGHLITGKGHCGPECCMI
jgi:hypothetical protein